MISEIKKKELVIWRIRLKTKIGKLMILIMIFFDLKRISSYNQPPRSNTYPKINAEARRLEANHR